MSVHVTEKKSIDDIVALCKRRGFVFPASEIYGGLNGFWDYGPLGTELKNNLRDAWWNDMVSCPPLGPDGAPLSIVGVDTSIVQNPKVWEASGHIGSFNDPMVDDKETKERFRADHLQGIYSIDCAADDAAAIDAAIGAIVESGRLPDRTAVGSTPGEAADELLRDKKLRKRLGFRAMEALPEHPAAPVVRIDIGLGATPAVILPVPVAVLESEHESIPSPYTGKPGTLTEPRQFNLMFKTYVGAAASEDNLAYLRPETAQGIFLNYKNVLDTMRVKVPFGIAQIGKAFRNEVNPRNFIFRSREFEQMEMEWFCHPDEARTWYEFWCEQRKNWWQSIGVTDDNLQLRQHDDAELAHYAKQGCGTFDIEYRFPFTAPGFGELEGVAHRSNFDLSQHQEHARTKLEYFDQERNERYLPDVVEPAAGLSRGVLALLCEAYTPDPDRPSKVYMKFHPRMAPTKAAVFPLVNKDGMPEVATKLYHDLRTRFKTQLDVKQAIGKRYARMDEAGTPYCFTIDSDTLTDQTVTVRHRDTQQQERIGIDQVARFLTERLSERLGE